MDERDPGGGEQHADVPLRRSWPSSARETFLYHLKRRLRAARKRAVLAAEDRGARVPAFPSPPQHGPAVPTTRLPSSGMVGRRGGEWWIGLARSRAAPGNPAPKRGPADLRCPVEELAPGPSAVEGRKKAR
jgi:hypothetical protein